MKNQFTGGGSSVGIESISKDIPKGVVSVEDSPYTPVFLTAQEAEKPQKLKEQKAQMEFKFEEKDAQKSEDKKKIEKIKEYLLNLLK